MLQLMFALMAMGLLLASVSSDGFSPVSSMSLDAAYGTLGLMVILIVAEISYNSSTSALFLSCILMGTQLAFHSLGTLLGNYLVSAGIIDYASSIALSIVLVAVLVPLSISKDGIMSLFAGNGTKSNASNTCSASKDSEIQRKVALIMKAYGLTEREGEILRLMVQRRTNTEIAHELIISEGTVKTHTHRIYRKLGINSRAQLHSLADELKLD